MLDLLLIRADKGGNPQSVIDNQKKRFKSTEIVQESIDLVQKWKDIRQRADTAKMNYNNVQKEIIEFGVPYILFYRNINIDKEFGN